MTKLAAQKRLTVLWFSSSAVLALLFVVFTILGTFQDSTTEIWQWYSQNIVPSLTLILGSFYATAAAQDEATAPQVDMFYYHMCFYISLFYLLALCATVLAVPTSQLEPLARLKLLNSSKLYLTIFQGVVSYSLGVFFVKSSPKA
jgi:hypothetical protein